MIRESVSPPEIVGAEQMLSRRAGKQRVEVGRVREYGATQRAKTAARITPATTRARPTAAGRRRKRRRTIRLRRGARAERLCLDVAHEPVPATRMRGLISE